MPGAEFKLEHLKEICEKLFRGAGVGEEDAEIISEILLAAEIRGIRSHGLMRVEHYIRCIKAGGIRPEAKITVEKEVPSWALIDGNGGLGAVISYKAMNYAIRKAEETGIGMVNVKNSHHFGAAGYYAMMCAAKDMIGIAMSNADPTMAVTGSASKTIGNNPFAFAAPAEKYGAVSLDIAMSKLADGKLQIARELGKHIAEGAIIDKRGGPSVDPDDYFDGGALLPFGEHKGYGLAFMVECLAGILSGAAVTEDIRAWNKKPGCSGNTGHFFLAADIEKIMPASHFKARVKELIERMHSAPKAANIDRILFPGQLEIENETEVRRKGTYSPSPACLESLRQAADGLGLSINIFNIQI